MGIWEPWKTCVDGGTGGSVTGKRRRRSTSAAEIIRKLKQFGVKWSKSSRSHSFLFASMCGKCIAFEWVGLRIALPLSSLLNYGDKQIGWYLFNENFCLHSNTITTTAAVFSFFLPSPPCSYFHLQHCRAIISNPPSLHKTQESLQASGDISLILWSKRINMHSM